MTGQPPLMANPHTKKAKNFAEADRIRDELKRQGIEVTDVKGGAAWKRLESSSTVTPKTSAIR